MRSRRLDGRDRLENPGYRFGWERARFMLDWLNGLQTLHGVDLDDRMTDEPAVKSAERTLAPAACSGTELPRAFKKDLDGCWCHSS